MTDAAAAGVTLDDPEIVTRVWKLLRRSPYGGSSRTWAQACVVIAPEGDRVVHRLALSHELANADLPALAVEARNRRVPRGSCLAFVQYDDAGPDGGSFVGFILVDLVGEPKP
jgi:hypothetical protein